MATAHHELRVRVHYPAGSGRTILRSDADWNRDIQPVAESADGAVSEFVVAAARPYAYFKPLRQSNGREAWSSGHNYLAVAGRDCDVYPNYSVDDRCSACELRELEDANGRRHAYRVFYPPGYDENTLRRFPVLYMQDGQNLFFPGEAFQGVHWRIAETLTLLDDMNAIQPVIVVGIYPNDRMLDYTKPGYDAYGRFLARVLKPAVDAEFRTLPGPATTAVMGSSLGGVVSFYLAWQYPEVFGMAACLSSTFGWRDDLVARVAAEARRPGRFYLDSGWPGDNYEATRHMRDALLAQGYRDGSDLHYLAFPEALHNERDWALRAHIPFQLFFGERGLPSVTAGDGRHGARQPAVPRGTASAGAT